MQIMQKGFEKQDFTVNIEDYSGRNFDTDVLDTIVENSHHEPTAPAANDEILDEEHWAKDSFDQLEIDQEF